MSEEQSIAIEGNAAVLDVPMVDPMRGFFRGRWFVRWVALLYSVYFFVAPAYRHPLAVWMEFAVVYAVFLVLYFLAAELAGRGRIITLGLFFLFAFLYYSLSEKAYGVFVYPFGMLCLLVPRFRTLFLALITMTAGVLWEIRFLGRSFSTAEEILFICVIIGLSNFSIAQQMRANALLEHANSEIERLSKEAERARIARDLHDLLGHTLTVIAVKLDLARRLLSRDMGRARNEIGEAEQTARNALAEVRKAVSGYRAEGLDVEISRARRSLIAADVKLTTTRACVNLSPAQVNVLSLVLREAVTNIIRHAHATECRLALVEEGGMIGFSIDDDGQGGPIREGNGIRGIRERIQSITGSMNLTTSTNRGTHLEITFPLAQDSQPQSASHGVNEAGRQ